MSVQRKVVSIEADATESTAVEVDDYLLSGFKVPSGWTTSDVTFKASETAGGTFVPVFNEAGEEMTLTAVAASRWYAVDPATFAGIPYLKLVAGTTQTNAVDVIVGMRRND